MIWVSHQNLNSQVGKGKEGPSGPHLHLNDTPLSVKYPRHLQELTASLSQ